VVSSPLQTEAVRDENQAYDSPPPRAATSDLPEFQPLLVAAQSEIPRAESAVASDGVTPVPGTEPFSLCNPALERLASIDEGDFRRVFAHSPVKRAKYRGWLRNLCVAAGNSGDGRFIPWLKAATDHPDPTVREHAAWALRRLEGGVP
jgi:hypothetical protein